MPDPGRIPDEQRVPQLDRKALPRDRSARFEAGSLPPAKREHVSTPAVSYPCSELIRSGGPHEVLARIVVGDPLGIVERACGLLNDPGVNDNLGLESACKAHEIVLVSDAGGQMKAEGESHGDWARHALRVLDVIDNQVSSLRKRQLIDSDQQTPGPLARNKRRGTYLEICNDIAQYKLSDAPPFPFKESPALANIESRLEAMPDEQQEGPIHRGYAVCGAAVRKHLPGVVGPAPRFPYPKVEF